MKKILGHDDKKMEKKMVEKQNGKTFVGTLKTDNTGTTF